MASLIVSPRKPDFSQLSFVGMVPCGADWRFNFRDPRGELVTLELDVAESNLIHDLIRKNLGIKCHGKPKR